MYFNQKEIEFMLEQYYGKMMKDNIVEFATNLIVNGASSEEVGLRVLEVTYSE